MKIYNDYLQTIQDAISADRKTQRSIFGSINEDVREFSFNDLSNRIPEKALLPSLNTFAQELGLKPNFDQQLGLHPDFAYLRNQGLTEHHYIVSVFIDIKGSTRLFAKYDPDTVLIITNTIQRAAIHTCLIFGGYVHRLHGDGLFVYFGGKHIDQKTAVLRALQSSSVFTYFVKNDLKNLFDQQGIDKINIRTGIDIGEENDVVWAMAGIGDISEVTTCSLHTSLASKMQSSANSNGIVVGDNIKKYMDTTDHILLSSVSRRTGNENDRYIFSIPEENFNYTQYDLDWFGFLKKQVFVATDLNGNLSLRQKNTVNPLKNIQNLTPIAVQSQPYLNDGSF